VKQFFDKLKEERKKAAKPRKAVLLCKARGAEEEGGRPAKEAAGSSEKASTFGL